MPVEIREEIILESIQNPEATGIRSKNKNNLKAQGLRRELELGNEDQQEAARSR